MDDMMNYIPANRLFPTISDRDITSKALLWAPRADVRGVVIGDSVHVENKLWWLNRTNLRTSKVPKSFFSSRSFMNITVQQAPFKLPSIPRDALAIQLKSNPRFELPPHACAYSDLASRQGLDTQTSQYRHEMPCNKAGSLTES